MKALYLEETSIILNFNQLSCDSESKVLSSRTFKFILMRFIRHLKQNNNHADTWVSNLLPRDIINIYKSLLVWDFKDLSQNFDFIKLNEKTAIYEFTESLYDYWRSLERFAFLSHSKSDNVHATTERLLNVSEDFNQIVLKLYRSISQKLLGSSFTLYRQLPAGVTASFSLVNNVWSSNESYKQLSTHFVTTLVLRPPFMVYSKANTRTGLFKETNTNPLNSLDLNKDDYFVFPVWVGKSLAYVYTHKTYLKHGVSLGGLFQMANFESFKNRKPDLLYIYGHHQEDLDGVYYYDEKNHIYVGSVSLDDKNDYFGYAKKMLLTLHNVKMIHEEKLPIHGAMIEITMTNQTKKNLVIIGDSGAGKSETIEALSSISTDAIKAIKVIYDDMGSFSLNKDHHVVSQGTEIGAFVRLDDLDTGYAYRKIDRAVFLNPNKVNARVILPTSSYDFVVKDHIIDYVFYANNYTKTDKGYQFFDDLDTGINIFKKGLRLAKGTTNEIGMSESYFANPFGPVQHEKQTETLLINYFKSLKQQGVKIGEVYTQLGIKGHESEGPKKAAKALLDLLINLS